MLPLNAHAICTFFQQNYSITIHEWVDEDNNRARIDEYRTADMVGGTGETGYTSSLYLYDTDSYIHTNDTGCYGDSLESRGRALPTGGTTGADARIGSTAEMFRFGAQMQARQRLHSFSRAITAMSGLSGHTAPQHLIACATPQN